jgi:TolB-like protein/DNA-binding winged helix-turn-helix (wHTH) protein/Flp pilus assembly protein TadD
MKQLRVGDWNVYPELNRLTKGEATVQIEPKVMDVLAALAAQPGEVLSRDQIIKTVWPDTFVTDEVLSYSIAELRKALQDDARNPAFIQTIPRRGYRLIAPVSPQPDEAAPPPPSPPSASAAAAPSHWWRWAGAAVLATTLALATVAIYLRYPRVFDTGAAPRGSVVLAVLPFENLSGNPDEEYFSDGLTEELISRLGGLDPAHLRVIARTSAMKYKGAHKSVDQISRELQANYILEGSVRREGRRVRISAQLIRADDQTHVWSEMYDRELSGVLSVQNEVAQAVARRTQLALSENGLARLNAARSVVPEAHEAYLRGRFLWNKRDTASFRKATEYFQESIRLDPGYAPAYCGLADTQVLLVEYGYAAPEAVYGIGKAAVAKALEIDGTLAEAYASRGMLKYSYEWDWAGAEQDFRLAIELNPSYTTAHHWYANLLSSLGRFEDARTELERAVQTDMFSPITHTALGWRVYAYSRQYDKALRELQSALELDEHYLIAHRRLGIVHLLAGRSEQAIAEIQRGISEAEVTPLALGDLGHAYAVAGRKPEAIEVVERLKKFSESSHVDASRIALIYAGAGEKGLALEWLEKALRQRDMGLIVIRSDPRFDPLRSEPRFQAVVRGMRFPG